MADLRKSLIRSFLSLQKSLQRHSSITSARRLAKFGDLFYRIPRDVSRECFLQDGLAYEWLIPRDAAPGRAILFFHGGFTFPLTNPTRCLAGVIARQVGTRVLLVDFRLAPEHRFPAALEDCVRAYRWLISNGGIPPQGVMLVGESAGGSLALAVMLSQRDAGIPLPARAVLISPVVDIEGGSSFQIQNDPMASPEFARLQFEAYRGEANPRDPLLSPIFADLEGLPPLLIQVGSEELLRGGAEDLAAKARHAGVPVRLEIWPGMWHYWHSFLKFLPEAQQAVENIEHYLV